MEPKILIADDEPTMRALLRATLDGRGVELFEAADGATALALAQHARPDLLFLDWMMPGLSGVEVCRRLRAQPETAGLTIVILTARAQEADRQEALAAGADDYVTKPFSPLALLEKVRATLGARAVS